MRVSLNDIRETEQFLTGQLNRGEVLIFETRYPALDVFLRS